ncbi:hypothetical protein JTB14_037082 [Gonioctena quinquepunctata]|nr:hypothetical protein JTB14_037082 [Gonioctena quinquepunctata]
MCDTNKQFSRRLVSLKIDFKCSECHKKVNLLYMRPVMYDVLCDEIPPQENIQEHSIAIQKLAISCIFENYFKKALRIFGLRSSLDYHNVGSEQLTKH